MSWDVRLLGEGSTGARASMEVGMAKVQTMDNRLVEITRPGESLVVKKLSAPYQNRLTIVAALFASACILVAIAITVAREYPLFKFFVGVLGFVAILVALRMLDMRASTARDEVFRFDVLGDKVERNGQPLAKASEVDHVLVRRVRRNDNEDIEDSDYALVIALQSTKRFTVAEADGVPGSRGQIMRAAEEVAQYLGVAVKEGERLPSEEWMDR
jgi:hypothetical protein